MTTIQQNIMPLLQRMPRAISPAMPRFGQDSQQPQVNGRTIVVPKTAQVERMPDAMRAAFTIRINDPMTHEALVENLNQRVGALVKGLKDLNLPKLRVSTGPLSFFPIREERPDDEESDKEPEPPKLLGYGGGQTVDASVKGVSAKELPGYASKILSLGVASGINSDYINGPSFYLANQAQAEKSAARKAMKMATSLARTIAEAAGFRLGPPKHIESGQANNYGGGYGGVRSLSAMKSAMPQISQDVFQLEPQAVSSSVTVHFDMMDPPKNPVVSPK